MVLCILHMFEGTFSLDRHSMIMNSALKMHQGPVVQSIISLTSLLVVKMLTVLIRTISNSQEFLLKKCQ